MVQVHDGASEEVIYQTTNIRNHCCRCSHCRNFESDLINLFLTIKRFKTKLKFSLLNLFCNLKNSFF